MAMIRWFGENDSRSEFDRLGRDINRLMNGFNSGWHGTNSCSRTGVYPPLNIYDDGESLIVRAEVPGIAAKDINITATQDTLTISGERKSAVEEGVSYHRRERDRGSFHRSMTLPGQVNREKVMSTCRDRILEIRMPRAEHAMPRRITIK